MKDCFESFVAFLNGEGYSFNSKIDSDGDGVVSIPFDGKMMKCFFSGTDKSYLSIYEVFESIPEDKVAEIILLCNSLNCQYKWITFYVDKDNDMMLHVDARLSCDESADEAMEMVARMARIGKEIKPMVMKAIYA
ncbi:MAG: YbjN domain-containing protein [Clostridia bacterium]|nr:YbjN domain-containing protein [Clostridia bacterium]